MVAEIPVATPYPRRFRSAPRRAARIARPLGLLARVREPDETLLAEIGRRMTTRDEVGAALVRAMGRDRDDPERVTMRAFHEALAAGGPRDGAPAALRAFFDAVTPEPPWLDHDLLERGARAYRRLGTSREDVLLGLSLIGGYRYGGPTELLVRTGGLTGSGAMRRLGETQAWGFAVSRPGGMARGGEGWRASLHVRAMHALVANRYERDWDTGTHGLPINQADLAATLGLFNSTALLGCRLLGRHVPRADSDAIMHLWRYVGWLMGVDEDWLFTTERPQNAFNYHILLAQGDVTPSGPRLTAALVEGVRAERPGWRGAWERRRLLSLLRVFLQAEGMRDLGLPVTAPWIAPSQVLRNVVESVVVARFRRGRRWLEERSDRRSRADLARRFGPDRPEVGSL
ncbi:oxygenase MpaB family protein [Pseudonocardia nantongensis]|uniref:oxygenase MpaB family protein n=1 Tax=Pseudonocardia nantongensis TaxID=1181885 RepID=UPI00397D044E